MGAERRGRRQGTEKLPSEEVRLFLDSSVLLAATGSTSGASRLLITSAKREGWILVTSAYCVREVEHNLPKLKPKASIDWRRTIKPALTIVGTHLVLDRPLLYRAVKDRPVVITALSLKADTLLTLDRDDFHDLLGSSVYGLPIRTPGEFLKGLNR
ncbi:MAG: PIN domain-containing protein [Verrucomicrobia bacterium]|nr:PIN domain-containing protein [Verrucomicrobiota bacterium]NBY37985.1 PIN domain-containing protein [Verrucomicrobiota bacterium]